jgi:hypothetical protein
LAKLHLLRVSWCLRDFVVPLTYAIQQLFEYEDDKNGLATEYDILKSAL